MLSSLANMSRTFSLTQLATSCFPIAPTMEIRFAKMSEFSLTIGSQATSFMKWMPARLWTFCGATAWFRSGLIYRSCRLMSSIQSWSFGVVVVSRPIRSCCIIETGARARLALRAPIYLWATSPTPSVFRSPTFEIAAGKSASAVQFKNRDELHRPVDS